MTETNKVDFFVVGLSNPANRYKNTRHNVGAMALYYIAERFGFSKWEEAKANALVSKGKILEKNFVFIIPQTYMNRSGEVVLRFLNKESAPKKLIIFQDDVDISFGFVRRKACGGSGGHNGVLDIIKKLGTNEFQRVKIGVAKTKINGKALKFKDKKKTTDFLLQKFTVFEKRKLKKEVFEKAKNLLIDIIKYHKEQNMELK